MDSWIVFSGIMFSTSVLTYLLIRKLQIDKVDNAWVTFAASASPSIFLLLISIITGGMKLPGYRELFIIFISGVFLSYIGNKASIKAVKMAPNPGYSLIIQKSYAPVTAVLSVVLFNSILTIEGIIGIVIIIISAAQVMIDGPVVFNKKRMGWIFYSFISFFLFGTLSITAKYLVGGNITPLLFSTYIFIFAGIAFAVDYRNIFNKKSIRRLKLKSIFIMLTIGCSQAFFNIYMWEAVKAAPNIGYVNIINSASISVVTIFSAILFKDKLTTQKILGIIGVTCGLVLLFL